MNSAIIIISSPLQAICAIDAIKEFNIQNYKVIILEHGKRTAQIENFFNKKNIKFNIIKFNNTFLEKISSFFNYITQKPIKYNYMFIGDLRLLSVRIYYTPYLMKNGKIIFLDDGSYLPILLNNKKDNKKFLIKESLYSIIAKLSHISYKNLFSYYAEDIVAPQWNIMKNELTVLRGEPKIKGSYILIIGTVTDVYCKHIGLSIEEMIMTHTKLFNFIKTKYDKMNKIIYIPHGRDCNSSIKKLCTTHNVDFTPLTEAIELYLLEKSELPSAIFGFTSSALYTIHKIYPEIDIYNIVHNKRETQGAIQYEYLNQLYKNHGIKPLIF